MEPFANLLTSSRVEHRSCTQGTHDARKDLRRVVTKAEELWQSDVPELDAALPRQCTQHDARSSLRCRIGIGRLERTALATARELGQVGPRLIRKAPEPRVLRRGTCRHDPLHPAVPRALEPV